MAKKNILKKIVGCIGCIFYSMNIFAPTPIATGTFNMTLDINSLSPTCTVPDVVSLTLSYPNPSPMASATIKVECTFQYQSFWVGLSKGGSCSTSNKRAFCNSHGTTNPSFELYRDAGINPWGDYGHGGSYNAADISGQVGTQPGQGLHSWVATVYGKFTDNPTPDMAGTYSDTILIELSF